jgi:hypothetical protein
MRTTGRDHRRNPGTWFGLGGTVAGIGAVLATVAALVIANANTPNRQLQLWSSLWFDTAIGLTVLGLIPVGIGIVLLFKKDTAEADSPGLSAARLRATRTVQPETPTAAEVRSRPPERHVAQRTAEELWGLFAGLTDMQAGKVVEPLLGQWMEVAGLVRSVGQWTGTFSQVTFDRKDHHTIFLMFRDKSWLPRLSALKAGDRLIVHGRIERIGRLDIQLTDCELVKDQ